MLRIIFQSTLISFQRKYIVSFFVSYRFRYGSLTPHRINSDYAILNLQFIKEFGNSRDFIRFLIDFLLAQDNPVFIRPGTDCVYGRFFIRFIKGASNSFAVYCDNFAADFLGYCLDPFKKTLLQMVCFDCRKNPPESIV